MDIHKSSFILSPHKISICLLLNGIISKEIPIPKQEQFISYLLSLIIRQEEIQEKTIHELENDINQISKDSPVFMEIFASCIESIKTIDDIFVLFANLKEMRLESGRLGLDYLEPSGVIDLFIRRCLLAFNKMMFEELFELYSNFVKYVGNEQNFNKKSPMELEKFTEKKAIKIEQNTNTSNMDELSSQLESIHFPKFPKKYLLKAINDAEQGYSIPAIENLHKYFNYPIPDQSKQRADQIVPSQLNVHHACLNQARFHVKFGNLDEALLNINETIKIAETRNDKEGIMYSLFNLQEVLGELGFREEQKIIIEHILSESALQPAFPYLFILCALNYGQLRYLTNMADSDTENSNEELLWKDLLKMCNKKILQFHQNSVYMNQYHDYLNEFRPLAMMIQSLNYMKYPLMKHSMKLAFQIVISQYSNCLANPSLRNLLILFANEIEKENPKYGINALDHLDRLGENESSIERIPLILKSLHKEHISLNNFGFCIYLEKLMFTYLRSQCPTSLTSAIWSSKNERLVQMGKYTEANKSIQKLIKFSKKNGLDYWVLHQHLLRIQIFLNLRKYEQALMHVLKSIEIAERVKCEISLIQAHLYLSEVYLGFDLPLEALKLLQEIHEPILSSNSSNFRAQEKMIKAKATFLLARKSSTSKLQLELFQSGLRSLNKSLADYIGIFDLKKIRECYYLMAIIFDSLGDNHSRDKSSLYYMISQERIKQYSESTGIYFSEFHIPLLLSYQKEIQETTPKLFQLIQIPNYIQIVSNARKA